MTINRKQGNLKFPDEMFLAVQKFGGGYRQERIYYSEKALRSTLPGYFDMSKPYKVYKLIPDENWKFEDDSTN